MICLKCGMYQGLCITPEIDHYYASQLQLINKPKKDQESKVSPNIILDNILSPVTNAEPQQQPQQQQQQITVNQIETSVAKLQLNENDNNNNNQVQDITMNDTEEMKEFEGDMEEENQRCQDIAKLLSHRQQQLIEDEDIVGAAKKGFEDSACLSLVHYQ